MAVGSKTISENLNAVGQWENLAFCVISESF